MAVCQLWCGRDRGKVSELERIFLQQLPPEGESLPPIPCRRVLYFPYIAEAEPEPLARLVQLRQ